MLKVQHEVSAQQIIVLLSWLFLLIKFGRKKTWNQVKKKKTRARPVLSSKCLKIFQMEGRVVGGGGRTKEASGKERHHRWPIRSLTKCHIQRYLPAQPGMNLLWGPDAANWQGILWLPPKENKLFATTCLFFPFQVECVNSFKCRSPKAHVHI